MRRRNTCASLFAAMGIMIACTAAARPAAASAVQGLPAAIRHDVVQPHWFSAAHGSEYWHKRSQGQIVYVVPVARRITALTFDDGPSVDYTPKILQVLTEFHARATFFMIGASATAHPWLVQEIYREGHEIGNHTEHHEQKRRVTEREIRDCDRDLFAITGQRPHLFRPPGGRVDDLLLRTVRESKHMMIMWTWDVDTKDWRSPGVQKIAHTVIDHIHPGDIVIFHDGGGKRSQTVAALRIVLKELTAKGYSFVTISQLLGEQLHHKIGH